MPCAKFENVTDSEYDTLCDDFMKLAEFVVEKSFPEFSDLWEDMLDAIFESGTLFVPASLWEYQILGKFSVGVIKGVTTSRYGNLKKRDPVHLTLARCVDNMWSKSPIFTKGANLNLCSKKISVPCLKVDGKSRKPHVTLLGVVRKS
jgi:hypothetical protein